MLHEPHAGVPGPALLVVVAHDVLVVGVRVFREVALDEVTSFFASESVRKVIILAFHRYLRKKKEGVELIHIFCW